MSIQFVPEFLLAIYPTSSARSKLESLLAQPYQQLPTPPQLLTHFIGFQFSNQPILNWLLLSTVNSTTYACIALKYLLSLSDIASTSLCLPQSPLPTSYQHCSYLSWFSICRPFSLEFPSSSSQIYRLLHCFQIKSKNSHFLRCKHFWPLTILPTRFWFDIIMLIFCVLKLLYYYYYYYY